MHIHVHSSQEGLFGGAAPARATRLCELPTLLFLLLLLALRP